MRQFQGARKYATLLSRLASIKQGSNETLKAYVKCFNEELVTIHNPQENGVSMAAINGCDLRHSFGISFRKMNARRCKSFIGEQTKLCAERLLEK